MKKKVSPLGQFGDGIVVERKSRICVNVFFDKQKYMVRDVFLSGKNEEIEKNNIFSSVIFLDKGRVGTLEISFGAFPDNIEEEEIIACAIDEAIEKR